MVERFEQLDKDLTEITSHIFPESHVKQALIAHGFLAHRKDGQNNRDLSIASPDLSSKEHCATSSITDEEKKRTTQLIYHFKEGKEFHSLKEPLSLVRYQRPMKTQPLWPVEVDSNAYYCTFLWDVPANPEPLYSLENPVIPPKTRSSLGEGIIVYCNLPGPEKFFTKARPGPNISISGHRGRSKDSSSLIFDSKFESGNLAKAIQVGRWDYELYLRFDLYTRKHTQWFYFSVQNMRRGQTYRFTIVNLYKSSSLYNEGMQPLFYSEKMAALYHIGWRRVGFNIKYFKTDIRRLDTNSEQYYYGLTWSYTFQLDSDICYFSHCYPYTYTELQDYLYKISSDPFKSTICKQRTLCYTIAGNPVPVLTITSASLTPGDNQKKKAVVVTARVHPGETNSSWMMKGLIDQLTSQSPDAKILRDAFVFKIIPMLNPDGVIVGNYRCSLTGRDLNRNYHTKLRDAYPTVWHTKQYIKKLSEERDIVVYCDLHGHSRKQNVFIYGCDNVQDPSIRLRSRVFPIMLSRNAPTRFSYESCNFKVQKAKEGTGRIFMWKELGILNSYTMEATFCGYSFGRNKRTHFSIKDFEQMGCHFCDTLLDYCDPDQSKVNLILGQLIMEYRQRLVAKLTALQVPIPPGVDPLDIDFGCDIYSELESSDSGSDSSDSDGPPVHLLKKKQKKHKKFRTCKEGNKQKVRIKLTHKLNQHSPKHYKPTQKKVNSNHSYTPVVVASVSNGTQQISKPSRKSSLNAAKEQTKKEEPISHHNPEENSKTMCTESTAAGYARDSLQNGFTTTTNKVTSMSSLLSARSYEDIPSPIAITPKVLQQPSLSKIKINNLPQISQTSCTSLSSVLPQPNGAFARSYVIHHLQEDAQMDTGWSHDSSTSGNMKNLVSLSKVFRQLKPHLLGSANHMSSNVINHSNIRTSTATTDYTSSSKKLLSCALLKEQQHTEKQEQILSPNVQDCTGINKTKSVSSVDMCSSSSLAQVHSSQSKSIGDNCFKSKEKSSSNFKVGSDHTQSTYNQPVINDDRNSSSQNHSSQMNYLTIQQKSEAVLNQLQSIVTEQELPQNMGVSELQDDYKPFHTVTNDTQFEIEPPYGYRQNYRETNGSSRPTTLKYLNRNGIIQKQVIPDQNVRGLSSHSQQRKERKLLTDTDNSHFHRRKDQTCTIADAGETLSRPTYAYKNVGSAVLLPDLKFTLSSTCNRRIQSGSCAGNTKRRHFTDSRPGTSYTHNEHEQTNKIIPSTVSLMLSTATASTTTSIHRPRPIHLRYYCNKKNLF